MDKNDELHVQIQYALVEKLSAANKRQAKILSLLDECIFECDKNFLISYANDSWTHKLGYSIEQLIGKKLTAIMNSRDILTFTTYSCAVLHDEASRSIEVQLLDNKGLHHWFEVRLAHDGKFGLIGSLYDIQRHKDYRTLLTQQQEYAKRLSLVASHTSNLVIITDRHGLIEWVNRSFEKLTGYLCEEVVGQNPGSLLQGPQSDEKATKVMSIAVKQGKPFQVETVNYTKDGTVYWVAIDATPVSDEFGVVKNFIAIETDITQRVKAEAAMAEIEYNYHCVVDGIPDIVLRMDIHGRLLFVNQAGLNLLHCNQDEAIGSSIIEYIADEDINKIKIALYDYRQGKRDIRRFDIRLNSSNQEDHWVEITLTPIQGGYDNSLTSIAAMLIDIQERVEASNTLLEAKNHAEMLAESKSRFMANISHEIRTPLNAVIGSADILHDSGLTQEQMRFTQMIKTSGDALLSILDDVLTYSRFESQNLTLNNQKFRLDTCLEEGIDIVSDGAIKKGLELVLDIHPDVPVLVVGDHARIRQLIINLLANAIKFTHEGSIIVETRCIKLSANSIVLNISVTDTGIGIAEGKLQTMFEPFIQSDSSITRQYGGSGLGLAICKQIIDAVGGKISVCSELQKGSVFTVEYPLEVDHIELTAHQFSEEQATPVVIWIAGDKPALNKAVGNMLKRYKIEFKQMLEFIPPSNHERLAGIIITDPHLLEQIRRYTNEHYVSCKPCIIVIDLSANNAQHYKVSDNEVMFNGPFKLSHFRRAVETLEEHVFQLGLTLPKGKSSSEIEPERYLPQQELYKNIKVLVAEDNRNNQFVIRAYLEQQGCQVKIVSNGQQAFEQIKNNSFDLVFMDIEMPILDGISATKLIRSDSAGQYVPIVALTANAIHGDKERFLQAGMNDYLAKPIAPKRLHALLAKYLKNHNIEASTKLTRLLAVWQRFK